MTAAQPYFLVGPRESIEIIDVPEFPTAVVRTENVPMSQMPEVMDSAFQALGAALGAGLFKPAGPAIAMYTAMDAEPNGNADVETGFPVMEALPGPIMIAGATIIPSQLPAGQVATITHTGSYDKLGEVWNKMVTTFMQDGYQPSMPSWEVYLTEPTPDADPEHMRTDLYCLVNKADKA